MGMEKKLMKSCTSLNKFMRFIASIDMAALAERSSSSS